MLRIEPHGSGRGVGEGEGEAAAVSAASSSEVRTIAGMIGACDARRQPPNGSSVRRLAGGTARRYRNGVMLELGLVLLAIVCFVILDVYVAGCKRV